MKKLIGYCVVSCFAILSCVFVAHATANNITTKAKVCAAVTPDGCKDSTKWYSFYCNGLKKICPEELFTQSQVEEPAKVITITEVLTSSVTGHNDNNDNNDNSDI